MTTAQIEHLRAVRPDQKLTIHISKSAQDWLKQNGYAAEIQAIAGAMARYRLEKKTTGDPYKGMAPDKIASLLAKYERLAARTRAALNGH